MKWKLVKVLTGGITVLAVCLVLTLSRDSGSSPTGAVVVVSRSVGDLGQISSRKEQLVPFAILNAGRQRLVLNELIPDCCCGNRVRRTILVAPGEMAEVSVLLDTRFSCGLVENTVHFVTNDPARPCLDLTARALVSANNRGLSDPDMGADDHARPKHDGR